MYVIQQIERISRTFLILDDVAGISCALEFEQVKMDCEALHEDARVGLALGRERRSDRGFGRLPY